MSFLTLSTTDTDIHAAKLSSCHSNFSVIKFCLLNQKADSPFINCIILLMVCSDPNEIKQWQWSLYPFIKSMKIPFSFAFSFICCHRSEEHTSELQSRPHLVCRLL